MGLECKELLGSRPFQVLHEIVEQHLAAEAGPLDPATTENYALARAFRDGKMDLWNWIGLTLQSAIEDGETSVQKLRDTQ